MWRLRWAFGVPMATLLLPATLYAIAQPNEYTASAIVRVRELSSSVGGGPLPDERGLSAAALVATTRDRLLSMTNLVDVVPILAPGANREDPELAAMLRRKIQFDRLTNYSFLVSVKDTDPDRASQAVNALLRTFLETEAQGPKTRAERTSQFYEDRVREAGERHQAALKALNDFETRTDVVLAEARERLMAQLERFDREITLQEQVARSAQARIEFLDDRMARTGPGARSPTGSGLPAPMPGSDEEAGLRARVAKLETDRDTAARQLALLLERYTEEHYSIPTARRALEVLEADLKAAVAALDAYRAGLAPDVVPSPGPSPDGPPPAHESEATKVMRAMRDSARAELEESKSTLAKVEKERDAVQARLTEIPFTEAARRPLQDDVKKSAERYAELRKQADAASELANYLRRSDADEVAPYGVDQWAASPVNPSGPARMRIILTALAIGAGIGYGLVVLRKRFHQGEVYGATDIADLIGGAMVVSVPLLPSGERRRWRLPIPMGELALGIWVIGLVGLSAFAYAGFRGWVPTPSWVRAMTDLFA